MEQIQHKLDEIFTYLKSIDYSLLFSTEFLSALAGAIAGGLIAYLVQIKALREARDIRNQDRKLTQQALGNALLFKMIRIYSNAVHLNTYIQECFEDAKRKSFKGEPWQFVRPLANPPNDIHFSADEMSLLLSLKDNDLFNLVVSQDVCHNSLNDAVKKLNEARENLTQRLDHDAADGETLSGTLDQEKLLKLRPYMINVNSLIMAITDLSKRNAYDGARGLKGLQVLFHDKLGSTFAIEFPEEQSKEDGKIPV